VSRRVTIGLDLGGTDLKAALVDSEGRIEGFCKRPSGVQEGPEAPFRAMEESARELLAEWPCEVLGVGLGSPGVIRPADGVLVDRTAHLPHWKDVALRDLVAKRLGLPAVVDNDANAAALAEQRLGAARDARSCLLVTLGTGIGCGIVIDGRVYRGAWGGAGEIGHVPLALGKERCTCGVPSCVEPEASASGLARRAAALGLEVDAAGLFARAAAGDAAAEALLAGFVDRLGAVLATAIAVLNPDVVVVGGGLSRAGAALMDPLRLAVRRYGLASHTAGLRLEPAALGERAGAIGAGLMAWEAFGRSSPPT
jgi:glucokinase